MFFLCVKWQRHVWCGFTHDLQSFHSFKRCAPVRDFAPVQQISWAQGEEPGGVSQSQPWTQGIAVEGYFLQLGNSTPSTLITPSEGLRDPQLTVRTMLLATRLDRLTSADQTFRPAQTASDQHGTELLIRQIFSQTAMKWIYRFI